MEEFLDAVTDGAIWGVGFGLAATAVRSLGVGLRPVVKGVVRTGVTAADWVKTGVAEGRENVEDAYHEAKASQDANTSSTASR